MQPPPHTGGTTPRKLEETLDAVSRVPRSEWEAYGAKLRSWIEQRVDLYLESHPEIRKLQEPQHADVQGRLAALSEERQAVEPRLLQLEREVSSWRSTARSIEERLQSAAAPGRAVDDRMEERLGRMDRAVSDLRASLRSVSEGLEDACRNFTRRGDLAQVRDEIYDSVKQALHQLEDVLRIDTCDMIEKAFSQQASAVSEYDRQLEEQLQWSRPRT